MIGKAAMLKRISKRRGNMSAIAKDLGCTRTAVSKHIGKDEELTQAVRDAKDAILDAAEENVYDLITGDDPDPALLKWFLSCQGRDRGYCTKAEEIDAKIQALRELVHKMILERAGGSNGDGGTIQSPGIGGDDGPAAQGGRRLLPPP
jgi:predicted transcriptional regulator